MLRGVALSASVVFAMGCTDELALGTQTSALVDLNAFSLPDMAEGERMEVVHRYDHLDPTNLIPRGLLEDTILYFDVNKAVIPKTSYVVVVDMSLHSGKDRYWLVDLASGAVEPHKVAHGDGSDPDNNGTATLFGNVEGSHKTSLGFYLTGEIYNGTHPHSMRLDGLSRDGSPNNLANTNARERLIVMHEADYVDDSNTSQQGRSNGCLALDPSIEVAMVDRIFGGSLIYTAITPLNTPVGRSDGMMDPPTDDPRPPDDDGEVPDDTDATAGCSAAGGSSGLLLALALLGLRRRRR